MNTPTADRISPTDAARLVKEGGGWIVDVREADEHRQEAIAGAVLFPSSAFTVENFPAARPGVQTLILCRSGGRAGKVTAALRGAGRSDCAVIEGGITGWAGAGLPVCRNAKAPMPIIRQVMIVVGMLGLAFSALAWWVHPAFIAGTAFLGAGLVFSGATGICAMANALAKMPWNNRATKNASDANCCAKTA
jgi:rhodanese-related sulfurtransferase